MKKAYQVKVYDIDGDYLKTFKPSQIMSDVAFTSKINGGQGQLNITLNLPIDDFDEGGSVDHMNFVRVYEIDDENSPEPRLIYTGFVSKYTPFFREGDEGVTLTCLGLATLLNFDYYRDADYTVSHSTEDPKDIIEAIVDHFNSVYAGSWITYAGGQMTAVGTTVTYEFVDKTWFRAIKKAYELSGENRWWYIDQAGEVHFKEKPASATHIFTLGHDCDEGEVEKDNEKIVNQFQLRYDDPLQTADFSDATSQTNYGRRGKVQQDQRITTAATRDQRGNQQIEDNKNPIVRARLSINTNYDIETIKPGDTCVVLNKKKDSTIFPDNMLITAVSYTPDKVVLTIEDLRPTFADVFEDAVNNKINS